MRLAQIAAFTKAQHEGIYTFLPPGSDNIMSKIVDLPGLMFDKPDGVFKLTDPTEEQATIMIESGLRRDLSMPNVFRGTPTFTGFPKVMALDPATYRPGPMEATPDAIVAYIFLLKGLAVFSTLSGTFARDSGGISFSGDAISDKGTLEVPCGRTSEIVTVPLDATGWKLAHTTSLHCIAVPSSDTRRFTSGYSAITNLTRTLYNHNGRFFPYFEGMVLPDRGFAYNVFTRVFPQLLNSDMSKVPILLQRIKKGSAALAEKAAGMALSHAYLGIQLAIQSHSTITFIITRQVYQGFILSGSYNLVLYRDVIAGIPAADCIADLQLLNAHDKAMVALKGLFEMKKLIDGTVVYPFAIETLNTSRRLLNYLRTIPFDDYKDIPDFWKNVDKEVDKLDFGDEFRSINLSSIELFLSYVQSGEDRLIANEPAFLRGGYFRSCTNNKVAIGLGMFGLKAPSCNFGPKGSNGLVFNIPKIGTEDKNIGPNGVLKKIPFQVMHPISAVSQWTTLFAEGILRLPVGDKKRSEFCKMSGVVYHLNAQQERPFLAIYDRIKIYSSQVRSMPGQKRKGAVTEDRGEGGSKGKKRRQDVSMY